VQEGIFLASERKNAVLGYCVNQTKEAFQPVPILALNQTKEAF
jgi:hypothetical protein